MRSPFAIMWENIFPFAPSHGLKTGSPIPAPFDSPSGVGPSELLRVPPYVLASNRECMGKDKTLIHTQPGRTSHTGVCV